MQWARRSRKFNEEKHRRTGGCRPHRGTPSRGNNDLIRDMRSEMWRWLDATYPAILERLKRVYTVLDETRVAHADSEWSWICVALTMRQ